MVADAETRKKLAAAGASWGQIIPKQENTEQTAKEFKKVLEREHPTRVILVGDVITDSAHKAGIEVDVAIIDGKTHRGYFHGDQGLFDDFETIDNPAGEIRESAWELIRESLASGKRVLISVNGEEDLLAIPAILEAPEGAIIGFGQPPVTDAEPPLPEGIAWIRITLEIKRQVRAIVAALPKA